MTNHDFTEQILALGQPLGSIPDDMCRFFDDMPVGIAVLRGPELTISFINQYCLDIVRQQRGEVVGRTLSAVMPELALLAEGIEAQPREILKFRKMEAVHVSGAFMQRTRYQIVLAPLRDAQAVAVGQVATFSLISETNKSLSPHRVPIEEEVNQEEILTYRKALLEAQNEAVPDAILTVDTRGKIFSFNQNFIKLWGIPQYIIDAKDDTAALRIAMTKVVDPEHFIARVTYCYQHPEEDAREEILFKDGRTIERYGNAVIGENGINYGWTWYFRDVSESRRAEKKVRDSEERYQNFIQQSSEGIWRIELKLPLSIDLPLDAQIEHLFTHAYLAECNDAMARMYGFDKAEELVGAHLTQFFPRDEHTEAYFKLFIGAGYKIESAESKELDRKGQTKYFLNNLVGFLENGKIIRAWGTQRDITTQKAVQIQLEESETGLRSLANAMPQVVWIAQPDGQVTYYNDRVQAFDGVQRTSAGNWEWEGMVHPNDIRETNDAWKNAVASGMPYQKEHRIRMTDGSYRWHLSRALPQRNESGAVIKWYGTATDVHDQRVAQDAIAESEARFRTLAETLPQMVWMTDGLGQQEYASARWSEYSGVVPNGADTWQDIVHQNDMGIVASAWKESMKTGKPYSVELRLKSRLNEYRWFYGSAEPIRNGEGEIVKWVGSFTDIHDQKSARERLEEVVAERTLALQRSNEDLQQFAHVASHDLKEPVRKIMTFVDLLSRQQGSPLSTDAKKYLAKISRAVERMHSMIEGVLLYSSLSETTPNQMQPIDLNQVITQIEADLELVIQGKHATIIKIDLPTIAGFEVLVYQLFYNLINNALKFSKREVAPIIVLRAAKIPSSGIDEIKGDVLYSLWQIEVEDNGIGFDQAYAEQIFKTFVRLNTKDRFEGTGLGLALCKKIVERHGGTIRAEGKNNQGAKFIITLPVQEGGV